MAETEPFIPAPHSKLSLGLMSIGEALLALPVEAIREVVPGHTAYARMPASAAGIIGAVALRGAIIPIFDLRISLGFDLAPLASHVILIMRSRGRVLGLVAEKICGMATVVRHDLIPIDIETDDPRPKLATHLFECEQGIATLLEADRIAALPGLPTVMERVTKADNLAKRAPILLFSFGAWNFGIDATFVAATVPRSAIERNALTGGFCLGVVDHHGYDMPVVDMAAALGLGAATYRSEAAVVAVRFGETAMLGFVIDQVHDIAQIPEDRILPIPALAFEHPLFFGGIWTDGSNRENLILDIARLRDDVRLANLASLRKPKLALQQRDGAVGDPRASHQRAEKSERFLTFRAGVEQAALITQITEILRFPREFASVNHAAQGMIGFFSHKGRATPLIALAAHLGHPTEIDRTLAHVLMTERNGIAVGFVVDSLNSIEPATWIARKAAAPEGHASASDDDSGSDMVLVGLGADRRVLQCVDFARELRTLTQTRALDPSVEVGERRECAA